MTPKEQIERLRSALHRYNYEYYTLDSPSISDYEFDSLLKELQALENAHPQYFDPNSPTQRVGGQISKKFETVTHRYRMYSLDNVYSLEELEEWEQRSKRLLGVSTLDYTCEPKYDGVSISLIYKNGLLERAVTRGDGFQGDDVTNNVRTIKSIPLRLAGDFPEDLEARGEIIFPLDVFKELNEKRRREGEELYKNPRNTASGTLKLQDSREVAQRRLDCLIYAIAGDVPDIAGQIQSLKKLSQWGFKTPKDVSLKSSLEAVSDTIRAAEKERYGLPYDTDGIVIKINDFHLQSELGYTAKSPRWAVAYKFKTEQATSVLESVSYQVGRTGAITPVANLAPVLLAGTVVKRASLHNADQIEKLELHLKDEVFVEKGGEIIPKIVGVNVKSRLPNAEKITLPTNCPECRAPLVRREGEAQHYCENIYGCPPQVRGRIVHFISRKAMNIEGLGIETVSLLIENKLVETYADLYDLRKEQLLLLDRMADKSADNLINGIAESKKTPYEKVLYALGIRHVGETVAKKLAQAFPSIEILKAAQMEALGQVEDIGERIAKSVIEFFQNPINQSILEKLKSHGLLLESNQERKPVVSDRLKGLSFVVSGVFEAFSRDQLKALIESHGGAVAGSISKKTDYLVAGANMGPAKREKAEQLGVKMMSEQEFRDLLET